ncbi:MAG: dTMP kinase [Chloroflexi bacterium]|nr:dTMP kinase [Chloroflexota bacterium]
MFIVFEGVDGAGKTTQIEMLAERLRSQGPTPHVLHEPGGTGLGSVLRRLLKDRQPFSIGERAELLLFGAARAQLIEEVVRPALAAGQPVLLDRYVYSTVAYQGAGRGLDTAEIAAVNATATGGLEPDLVLLLDLPVATALGRQDGREFDRFDQETLAFYQRVNDSYQRQANAAPARWRTFNAAQTAEELAECIWTEVQMRWPPA